MSEINKNWYFLSTVVDDFCDDNSISHLWMKCLKWGQRGLRDIRMNVFQQPKTCLLDVTERHTAVLPVDYVDWTKIAVKNGQYAITLATNDDMTVQDRSVNDTFVSMLNQNMPNGVSMNAYTGYYFYNYNSTNLFSWGYGAGLPSKGYVKVVDRGTCKEILLDYDYPYSQVYLEYISDGIDPCKETVVSPYEYEYLMVYMQEKYERFNNPKSTQSSVLEAGRDVFFAEKKLRAQMNDLSPKDIVTMSRAESRLTPKL